MSFRLLLLAAALALASCMRLGLNVAPDATAPDGDADVDADGDGDGDGDGSSDADGSDEPGDADADGGCPALPCVELDPSSNACAEADEGPFVALARHETGFTSYGVWPVRGYLLLGDTTGGLRSFDFDGAAFREIDNETIRDGDWVEAFWNRGRDVYVGVPGHGLFVFWVGDDGTLTKVADDSTTLTEARRAWGDGTYTYVPNGPDGLFAYTFDGAVLSQVGAAAESRGFSQAACVDGDLIYFADNTSLRVMSFDGSTFTELASEPHTGVNRVWAASGVAFAVGEEELRAYRLDTDRLEVLSTFPLADRGRDVWSDGVHVFVAASDVGLLALRLDGGALVEVDHVDTDGSALGVVGDGTYIYVGDGGAGVKAFGGFACRRLAGR